jgi:uncharacterized protein (TIGR00251 family)
MEGAVRFSIRLTPRGGVDRIDGVGPGRELRVRVAAPPVDEAANRALVRLIADELGVPQSSVEVASGGRARSKQLQVEGVSRDDVRARWPGIEVSSTSR